MKNFNFVMCHASCVIRHASCLLLLASCLLPPVFTYGGEYDTEIAKQTQVYEADPTNLDAAYQLGNCLAWDKRYEEALKIFSEILSKEPKYEDAEIGIARIYSWMGDQEKAVQKYQDIIANDPQNFEAYQGLGSLALWASDFEKSIEHFEKALAINPKDIVSLKGIGRAYLGRGDRRRAEEYFTRAEMLEIRQTPLSVILAISAGIIVIALVILLVIRSRTRYRKRQFLRMELKILRYALSLYYKDTGKFPLAIESLVHEKWRPQGEKEDRSYLEGVRQGDRGFIIDPFGKRYWYNPDTGGVYSTTKGCEKW